MDRIVKAAPSAKQVALFSHLPQFEKVCQATVLPHLALCDARCFAGQGTSLSLNIGFSDGSIHAAIVALGLRLAAGTIHGAVCARFDSASLG